jgi:hypothetical protein
MNLRIVIDGVQVLFSKSFFLISHWGNRTKVGIGCQGKEHLTFFLPQAEIMLFFLRFHDRGEVQCEYYTYDSR